MSENEIPRYGQYVLLPDPEPDACMVREAKRRLCRRLRGLAATKKGKVLGLKFFVMRRHPIRDPDTGEMYEGSKVGYMASIRREETAWLGGKPVGAA